MIQSEREVLKEKIFSKMANLQSEIDILVEQSRPLPLDNYLSNSARTEIVHGRDLSEGALSSARLKLLKLECVLRNIEGSSFGICSICQGPIPYKRILAIPESSTCIDCADDE